MSRLRLTISHQSLPISHHSPVARQIGTYFEFMECLADRTGGTEMSRLRLPISHQSSVITNQSSVARQIGTASHALQPLQRIPDLFESKILKVLQVSGCERVHPTGEQGQCRTDIK